MYNKPYFVIFILSLVVIHPCIPHNYDALKGIIPGKNFSCLNISYIFTVLYFYPAYISIYFVSVEESGNTGTIFSFDYFLSFQGINKSDLCALFFPFKADLIIDFGKFFSIAFPCIEEDHPNPLRE